MIKLEHTQHVPNAALLKPVIGGLIIIPISLTLWIFGNIRSNYLGADGNDICASLFKVILIIPTCANNALQVYQTLLL